MLDAQKEEIEEEKQNLGEEIVLKETDIKDLKEENTNINKFIFFNILLFFSN